MKKKYYLIAIVLALALSVYVVQATGIFVRFVGSDTVYKAYQTAQQFFDDGGAKDFSNVQVIGQEQNIGSVSQGNEYYHSTMRATTTPWILFKNGPGAIGSIIINILGAGNAVFYDATTTDVNKRVGATTTLDVIAVIGASQAAGTYVYDTWFRYGLLGVFNGAQGTSTLMWR